MADWFLPACTVRTVTVYQVFVCPGGSGYMKRLADTELPLPLCLRWVDAGTDALNRTRFVLQENDTGEIMVCRKQCDIYYVLPRCMQCRRGLAMRILSICPSVRLSVCQTRDLWQNGIKICQRQSCKAFIGLTIHVKMIVGGRPCTSTWNFGSEWSRWSESADFLSIITVVEDKPINIVSKFQSSIFGAIQIHVYFTLPLRSEKTVCFVRFAVGGVQPAGVGEFLVNSAQRGRDLSARDQGDLRGSQDSDAAQTQTAQTRSYWRRCQAQTSRYLISGMSHVETEISSDRVWSGLVWSGLVWSGLVGSVRVVSGQVVFFKLRQVGSCQVGSGRKL